MAWNGKLCWAAEGAPVLRDVCDQLWASQLSGNDKGMGFFAKRRAKKRAISPLMTSYACTGSAIREIAGVNQVNEAAGVRLDVGAGNEYQGPAPFRARLRSIRANRPRPKVRPMSLLSFSGHRCWRIVERCRR